MKLEARKAGKGYRVWQKRTPKEIYKKEHSVFIKAEDSKQAERVLRRLLK